MIVTGDSLKAEIQAHREREACGTRYGTSSNRREYFEQIAAARYRLEPYIEPFANFPSARDKSLLEVGVGAGADFENWCRHARRATGVDLTETAIALTAERLALAGVPPERYELSVADAENLPFADASFDFVYSWGVLHHTPNTERALAEIRRVLKPGGSLRIMIYHHPSWCGLMVYIRHGLLGARWRLTPRQAVHEYLESPGTKTYTIREARAMLERAGLIPATVEPKLCFGDLLLMEPSAKYQSSFLAALLRLYPRWLVKMTGDRFGLGLLINAARPDGAP